jgi:predicted flap endonuclease-1-like 5' DNA nuclease
MAETTQDDRRFFFGPDEETKYYISTPTAEDIRGADWQYSKTYTQCLVEGITTSAEMMDILTRRGIIGPEFEQRTNELGEDLADRIARLEETEDLDVKRELSIEVARAREELFQWNQRLNGPMNNTAEQISDDARLEYLTSAMVVDENDERVWDSYETYLKEKSQALAMRARFEVMLFLQGLSSDFLDQTPEAQAMREVEQDILEKAEAEMKATEAVMQEEKEEAEKAKKPAPKKKAPKKKEDK